MPFSLFGRHARQFGLQAEKGIHRLDTGNYDHNLSYLIANDAQKGRYHKAMGILNRMLDKS